MNVAAAIVSLNLIDEDDDTDTKLKDGLYTTIISKLHQYYQISNLIDTALYSINDEALLQPRSDSRRNMFKSTAGLLVYLCQYRVIKSCLDDNFVFL